MQTESVDMEHRRWEYTSDNECDWTESGEAAIFIETALAERSDRLLKNVAENTRIPLSA